VNNALELIHDKKREELSQSKIYQNLCRELNNVNAGSSKILILIYSDMLENSNLFSFYRNINRIKEWNKDIEKAINSLKEKDCQLPDLFKADIHVISKRKVENDILINEAEMFWTKMFETTRATFHFDADLNLPLNH